MVKKLSKKKKKLGNTGIWLTHIIMQAITSVHSKYNGSLFSEYELIGQSNLSFNFCKQKLISGIRDHLNGKLSLFQIRILKYLGFKYIAYEHTHPNKNSKNMLSRKQTWLGFIRILVKKLSNNFFRGLKHHLKYIFNLFKETVR